MNLSPRLLAYKPRSDYFKQRWGEALAWVEEHNGGQVGNRGGIGNGQGRQGLVADVEGQAKGQKEQGTAVSMWYGADAVEAQVF
jgi:hypothetical protein